MTTGKQVLYFRTSTRKQDLGLDAQREAVINFLNGGDFEVIAEFQEQESGRKSDKERPELAKALRLCRIMNARLVVAKIDRLSRSLSFISALMDSSINFCAVDVPEMNPLTVGILAVVAQQEQKLISERTKAGLRQARLRGAKLGSPTNNLTSEDILKGQKLGRKVCRNNAKSKAQDLLEIVEDIKKSGITTFKGIAEELTNRAIPTPRNKTQWQGVQVKRLFERVGN